MALYNTGASLDELGRREDAVTAFDRVVERFGGSGDPSIAQRVAVALVGKGVALRRLGRADDAVTAFDQVVKRFGGSVEPVIAELVALYWPTTTP